MKYTIKFTTQFKKDIKLAKKQGKNLDNLFNDHALNNMGGVRDCLSANTFLKKEG